ncbi:unnamed protein product [marine sediment metagenome]|uniref:Lipoprotein n=1 Tax=marine sediment metagenome TaxID=412755 RepID=X0Y563_9ZZZZ
MTIKTGATLALCFICLLSFGCSTEFRVWEIEKATELCAEKGGVAYLDGFLGKWVSCRDGAMIHIERGGAK